jgi:hypothetical protein
MNDQIHYDIIADIHGRSDKLTALMERLGYSPEGDGFIPPAGHRALFLGDLIDPKPGHPSPGGVKATLLTVKAMCDRGDALCIMGNHELNAIYYHTVDPHGHSSDPDRNWLRYRGSKNKRMHEGTLADFGDYEDPCGEWLALWIPWMKSRPLSLDLGGFRAVHACWHPEMIARVEGKSLHDEAFFFAAADKRNPEGEALEILLKGIEVPMPAPHSFTDHTGAIRKNFRARWWEAVSESAVCCELVFPENSQIKHWPVAPEALPMFQPYAPEAPPVFFGHYFKPADSVPHPERHNVACLDHSAATGGPLVSYRWKGESSINLEHYICHL